MHHTREDAEEVLAAAAAAAKGAGAPPVTDGGVKDEESETPAATGAKDPDKGNFTDHYEEHTVDKNWSACSLSMGIIICGLSSVLALAKGFRTKHGGRIYTRAPVGS